MAAESDTRQLQMTIDLGNEQVLVERASCVEGLSTDYTLEVDFMSTLGEIDLLPHLGKPVSVRVLEDDEEMRHFHGIISHAEFLFEREAKYHYRLRARPFTFFLSHNIDMAIFQDKSVPDIVSLVLKAAGRSDADFEISATGTHPARTYCVQYRESDWGFLCRLMEEEGIYYYYRHEGGKHKLVMTDAPTSHAASKPGTLTFNPYAASLHRGGSQQRGGNKHFLEALGEKLSTGAESMVTLRSFDLVEPERPLVAQADIDPKHPGDEREVYSYPAPYDAAHKNFGKYMAERQLESLRRERQLYDGRSQATSLACGTKLTITKHPIERLNQTYLIIRTRHVIQGEDYGGNEDNQEDEGTHVSFEAIPIGTPFRALQTTPKPRVQGLESAIVSGPEGEEIYTDKYGRVKVRFHWDRADTTGDKSTCWVRVAQFGGLGNIILPRINQEVMVDFLNGDPDQPIVIGWVFNESQMPVYPLPDNKTRAVWRSKSYKGGTSTAHAGAKPLDTASPGANEIRFEDKSGKEEVFIHAEKDMTLRSRNDQTNHIGHNQYEKVFVDRDAFVGNDETTEIYRNQTLKITTGDQKEEICQGNRSTEIKIGNDTLKVAMGNIKVTADMGKIEIEAMQSITLTVGGSKITLNPVGVTVEGTMIKVKAGAMLQTEGPMVQQQASGIHIIKGGVVMIN